MRPDVNAARMLGTEPNGTMFTLSAATPLAARNWSVAIPSDDVVALDPDRLALEVLDGLDVALRPHLERHAQLLAPDDLELQPARDQREDVDGGEPDERRAPCDQRRLHRVVVGGRRGDRQPVLLVVALLGRELEVADRRRGRGQRRGQRRRLGLGARRLRRGPGDRAGREPRARTTTSTTHPNRRTLPESIASGDVRGPDHVRRRGARRTPLARSSRAGWSAGTPRCGGAAPR